MASKDNTDASLGKDTRFSGSVLLVLTKQYDGIEQEHEEKGDQTSSQANCLVSQFVMLDAIYGPLSSILFRFRVPVSGATFVYLQLLPKNVARLDRIVCNKPDQFANLDTIREKLGTNNILRLQFTLCGTGDLITPKKFEPDLSDGETFHNMRCITSLATSLDFSVYMAKDALTRSKFATFATALAATQEGLSDETMEALKRKADPVSLYNGKGGVVMDTARLLAFSSAFCTSAVAAQAPPPYSPLVTPQSSPASYASTVPVDTPPPSAYCNLKEADTSTLPTYFGLLGKRGRSPSNNAGPSDGKRNCLSSSAVIATGLMNEELVTAASGDLRGLITLLLAKIGSLENEVKDIKLLGHLLAKNGYLEKEVKSSQKRICELEEQNAQLRQQINDSSNNSSFIQGSMDSPRIERNVERYVKLEIERVREEFATSQEALEARVDVVEVNVDNLGVCLTCVEHGVEALDDRVAAAENGAEALDDRIASLESNPRGVLTPQQVVDSIVARLTH